MKKYEVEVNGETFIVSLKEISNEEATQKLAAAPTPAPSAPVEEKKAAPAPAPTGDGEVVPAPIAGIVLSVNKNVGDAVKKGDVLVILEAMKMENEIVASKAGVVSGIHVANGQVVNPGDALITIN